MIPFEFRRELWCQNTRVTGLSCGIICVILRFAFLIQYRSVTDTHTQTDRQTDRHTTTAYTALSKASRGKNNPREEVAWWPASVAQRARASELQCSEPGWLVRQGVGSSPTPGSMSSQVSVCYEIKFSGRYRRFACVLFKLWQAITPGSGASGVWWEPPVWITDGRGQRSYRKTAYRHPARKTCRLS